MGTVTCHLGAAIVHSSLTGALTPLTGPLTELVSPLRFRTRQARRGWSTVGLTKSAALEPRTAALLAV